MICVYRHLHHVRLVQRTHLGSLLHMQSEWQAAQSAQLVSIQKQRVPSSQRYCQELTSTQSILLR